MGVDGIAAELPAASQAGDTHPRVAHFEIVELDVLRPDQQIFSQRPRDRPGFVDLHGDVGFVEAHVDDAHLAGEERHQFGIDGKLARGHHRCAVRVLADRDLRKTQPRQRQDADRHVAVDLDRLAEHEGSLLFEARAIIRPVDEIRADHGGRKRQDQETAEKYE